MTSSRSKLLAITCLQDFFLEEINARALAPSSSVSDLFGCVGWENRLWSAYNRFEDIRVSDLEFGKLIFLSENQNVCFWGINQVDLNNPDGPVFQGRWMETGQAEDFRWFFEGDSVFVAFASYAILNAVSGGWCFSGRTKLSPRRRKQLVPGLDVIDLGGGLDFDYFAHSEKCLLAIDGREVLAAARTEPDWNELRELIPGLGRDED